MQSGSSAVVVKIPTDQVPGSAGTESEMERKPEVPASTQDEALFRCARPSGVPRGPATSTGSLASQSPWDFHHQSLDQNLLLGLPPHHSASELLCGIKCQI